MKQESIQVPLDGLKKQWDKTCYDWDCSWNVKGKCANERKVHCSGRWDWWKRSAPYRCQCCNLTKGWNYNGPVKGDRDRGGHHPIEGYPGDYTYCKAYCPYRRDANGKVIKCCGIEFEKDDFFMCPICGKRSKEAEKRLAKSKTME